MAHGDPVIHRDGVEFTSDSTCFVNRGTDQMSHVLQVDMSRYELGE
ncbi:MAG: hypothetical protein BWY82_02769 [Verrucomicrobia bacterium ADurb.Bin474]|nr:MAG: hypothetical protein BWY82_02769 [Verrucomicrobia bacterium ADurb.Bin474]